ncbi:MAG TPA: hypothetical protein VGC01_09955 [Mucilaginibacter sp.]
MKQRYLNKVTARLGIVILLAGAVFIINSCRKDARLGQQQALSDSVNLAKNWYEKTYPVITAGSGTLTTLSVNSSGGVYDYSQHIKPDWEHSVTYRRLGKSVIELPMDPSNKIQIALKNNNTGAFAYTKENTKTSFIILNDSKTNQAFVMTIMANASYIAGDPTKLAKNTYRHRDGTFTGLVVYSTPNGKFVRAYAYNNGILLAPPVAQSMATASLKTLSPCDVANNINTKINSVKQVNSWICTDWYQVTYGGGSITEQYLDSTCDFCGGGGGSTGTGDSGPGNSPDDPGSSGTTPSPCSTSGDPGNGGGGGIPPNQNSIPRLTVNDIGDGGMGDPSYCSMPDDSLLDNNPVKPCALKFQNITSNYMAVAVQGYTMGIKDNVFGTKFITFNVQIGMPSYISVQQAQNATALAMASAEATIANTHGVDFFLSAGAQITYSQEFASLVQAQLSAVFNLPVQVQNAITPGVPIITYANNNCQ